MSFKDQGWAGRFGAMGDEAEAKFEEVHQDGWRRFGLNRPPFDVRKLALKHRNAPDYQTATSFIEAQGFGKDQIIKVKLDKLLALNMWAQEMPTQLFLWDSHNRRYAYVEVQHLTSQLHALASIDQFHDGPRYWALAADQLEAEWQAVDR